MVHSRLLSLVWLLLTWSGAGYTDSYPNLKCCKTNLNMYGDITYNITPLICAQGCYFQSIPKPLPPGLKRFTVQRQNIPTIMTGDFPRLQSLETLDIHDSQVMSIKPGSFQNLPSLLELSMFDNKISRLEAETFKGLVKLEVLILSSNRIYYIDDVAFAGLTVLRKLFLSDNCLSSIPLGTKVSTRPLQLSMNGNPLASIVPVEELKHISRLVLSKNGIQCDCRLRQMKRWMLESKDLSWSITCADPVTGWPKRLAQIPLEDLKCASDVSSDYGAENVSFTCQTDCQEGLDLTFSWIAPNGDHWSSSREYSTTHTDVSESSCKDLSITRHVTRKTCYSVLHIPTLSKGMEGAYTCLVTSGHIDDASASTELNVTGAGFPSELLQNVTNETSTGGYLYTSRSQTTFSVAMTTRPGPGLSEIQLTLVGLAPFVGCSIIAAVIAACVSKRKAVIQQHMANARRNAAIRHHENTDMDSAGGVTYENDDQFSDTDGTRVHYENDDQFSATNEADRNQYENDDQFSDTKDANRNQYENDNLFSDTDAASQNQYENDDQFSDTNGASQNQYENDDQFSDTDAANGGHYENDDKFSDDDKSKPPRRTIPHKFTSLTPGKTSSLVKAKKARRRHNQRSLAKEKATSSSHRLKAKSKVLTVIAEVHAQAQTTSHYDNDKNSPGLSSSEAEKALDNAASDDGHYDNERPITDSATTASETAKRSDDGSDSDQDYMTLPNLSPAEDTGIGEQGKQQGSKHEDINAASTSTGADDVLENDYITFPGEENAQIADNDYITFPGEENTENVDNDYITCPGQENAQNVDNDYITFPGEENDENADNDYITFPAQQETDRQDELVSDLDTVVSDADDISDHSYVTLPNTKGQKEDTKRPNVHLKDLDIAVPDADDISDHFYVTLPKIESETEEQKKDAERQNVHVEDLDTVEDDIEDDSQHTYITFPGTENAEEQHIDTEH